VYVAFVVVAVVVLVVVVVVWPVDLFCAGAMLSKVYLLQELAELKGKDEEQREKTRNLIAKLTAHDLFRKNYYAYLLDKYQKAN
jgi:hypothetical protein